MFKEVAEARKPGIREEIPKEKPLTWLGPGAE